MVEELRKLLLLLIVGRCGVDEEKILRRRLRIHFVFISISTSNPLSSSSIDSTYDFQVQTILLPACFHFQYLDRRWSRLSDNAPQLRALPLCGGKQAERALIMNYL
jgi:hypothetical protein